MEKGTWKAMPINIQHAPRGMEADPLQNGNLRHRTGASTQVLIIYPANGVAKRKQAQACSRSSGQHAELYFHCFGAMLYGKGETDK